MVHQGRELYLLRGFHFCHLHGQYIYDFGIFEKEEWAKHQAKRLMFKMLGSHDDTGFEWVSEGHLCSGRRENGDQGDVYIIPMDLNRTIENLGDCLIHREWKNMRKKNE